MNAHAKIVVVMVLFAAFFSYARADERMYRCEFGIEGGCGYYMGDAADLPFQNVREMYGANFRYRFDQRWALQVQGVAHRITGKYPENMQMEDQKWTNQLINMDVTAEFNFFRFGEWSYDIRVKPISPYLFLGVGACLHGNAQKVAVYMPFGVGLKWKFAPRLNLQIAWQNNLYFTDNLENVPELNNTYGLNGSNILNQDMTGTISVGLTFEFAKDKKICRICNQ